MSIVKLTRAQYMKNWRDKNPDKCREYGKRHYAKMPIEQKIKKWNSLKEFTRLNPSYQKDWCIANRHRLNAKSKKRKLKIMGQIHPEADLGKIEKIFKEAPDGMEVDHIIPINCGGWHHELNLQYLPMPINRSKGDNVFYEPAGYKSWMDVPMFLLPDKCFLNEKN